MHLQSDDQTGPREHSGDFLSGEKRLTGQLRSLLDRPEIEGEMGTAHSSDGCECKITPFATTKKFLFLNLHGEGRAAVLLLSVRMEQSRRQKLLHVLQRVKEVTRVLFQCCLPHDEGRRLHYEFILSSC